VAKAGTSNPDRTISLKGCRAQLKINIEVMKDENIIFEKLKTIYYSRATRPEY
jgi:hypothetical protein